MLHRLSMSNLVWFVGILFLFSASFPIWLGLNDIAVEGIFTWSDGSNVTYKNWNRGEPNNLTGEDCVQLIKEQWNDVPCNINNTFVCKIGCAAFSGIFWSQYEFKIEKK